MWDGIPQRAAREPIIHAPRAAELAGRHFRRVRHTPHLRPHQQNIAAAASAHERLIAA
jgi:hypothetical protein